MLIFESEFPKTFRQTEIKKILDYVIIGKFCQLICVPGAGKATILRLLAHNRNLLKFHLKDREKSLRFVYINLLELTSFQETQIAKFLLMALDQKPQNDADFLVLTKQFTETINSFATRDETIILLFDHFDQYQIHLPRSFFQMLKSAKYLAKFKFSAVFATRRDLVELIDEDVVKDYWEFFVDNSIYLKIYDKEAAEYLFIQIEKLFEKRLSVDQRLKITNLTGGHAKLTKIISELVLGQNIELQEESILQNAQVRAALFELWLSLTSVEQHQLHNLATNSEKSGSIDDYLIKSDLLSSNVESNNLTFTIPIFKEFIRFQAPSSDLKITYNTQTREILKGKNIISELLTAQEFRLVRFLLQNQGRIIERDELISAVWLDNKISEAISDEAIDQMVFRLRKKIEDEPAKPKYLKTVKGRGLKFEQ
jgi:hypothetical protein